MYLNGDEIKDHTQLIQEIRLLIPLFAPRATVKRLFIDGITAIPAWEKAIKRLIDAGERSHFNYEEQMILPELQKLLSDTELKEVDYQSYRQMSPEQMIHMLEVLSPTINTDDRLAFLSDMKDCVPEKFAIAWPMLKKLLNVDEVEYCEVGLLISRII